MRINPRKVWKILGRFGHLLNTFLKLLHSRTTRCIGMNATLTTFYLIKKIKQWIFHILYFL
jgi:hypothetical protein